MSDPSDSTDTGERSPKTATFSSDALNVLCGLLMGLADVVPGVSGGTVALIVGVYERLVASLSSFDLKLIAHLRARKCKQAAAHIQLRFLITLGGGIFLGFLIMTSAINQLLNNEYSRQLTLASFFGMILASSLLVALMIEVRDRSTIPRLLGLGALGAAFAYLLVSQQTSDIDPSYGYLFICGAVAICAMILPGISGAMVLLIMGVYIHLTEIPHNLVKGENVTEGLLTILVFGVGCGISLICFSKFLRWLLARCKAATMAVLCGFMLGASPKLWPFQDDLTPHVEKVKYKQFINIWPESLGTQTATVFAIIFASMAFVFIVDWFTSGHSRRLFSNSSKIAAANEQE